MINEKQGFTLIELLSVILIISVLISISIPIVSRTARNFYFRNQAKKIETLLKYIKQRTILEQRAYKLLINSQENKFHLAVQNLNGADEFIPKTESLLKNINAANNIFINFPAADRIVQEIVFFPDGRLTNNEFYLKDDKNNRAKLTTVVSGEIWLEFL